MGPWDRTAGTEVPSPEHGTRLIARRQRRRVFVAGVFISIDCGSGSVYIYSCALLKIDNSKRVI